MIDVTRFNGKSFVLNAELIGYIKTDSAKVSQTS